MRSSLALVPLALCAFAPAQSVGSSMPPKVALEGFAQTGAKDYEDLAGRAVLFEFFAFW